MSSWFTVCFRNRNPSRKVHEENTATKAAAPRCRSLKGTAIQASPERLSVHNLANQYDSSNLGLLVLAYIRTASFPADALDSISAVYSNIFFSKLFGAFPSEGNGKCSRGADVLEVLQSSEPALLADLQAHLLRFAASEPCGDLNLYLPSRRYSDSPVDARDNRRNTDGAPSRRWLHALVEPILLDASAGTGDKSLDATLQVNSTLQQSLSHSQFTRTSLVHPGTDKPDTAEWNTEGRDAGLAPANGALPAIIVTFQPTAEKNPFSDSRKPVTATACKLGATATCGASVMMPPPSMDAEAITTAEVDEPGGRRPHRGLTTSTMSSSVPAPAWQEAAVSRRTSCQLTPGDCARIREGMVLAGLTPIVTAFTANGKAVLYQNTMSVVYFGVRPQGPSYVAPGGQQPGVHPDRIAEDLAGSILQELFSLEPNKLARMVADVCVEGRVWRGIVQVPATCAAAATSLEQLPPSRATSGRRAPAERCIGGSLPVDTVTGVLASATFASSGAVHQAQGACPLPRPSPAVGGTSLRQSFEIAPEATGELNPTGAAPASAASGADGGAGAGRMVASDITCSSMLNNAMLAVDEPPKLDVGGLQKMSGMLDVDPLATSTWGLLMDPFDATVTQETVPSRVPMVGERSSALTSTCSGMAALASARSTFFTKRILQTAPSVMKATEGELSPSACSICTASVGASAAPAVPSAASSEITSTPTRRGIARRRSFHRSSCIILEREAGVGSPTYGTIEADVFVSVGQVVGRAVPMSVPHTRPGNVSCGSRAQLQRCASRRDSRTSGSSPLLLSRMVAFASSLKTAPGVVQLALQQAVPGSAVSVTSGGRASADCFNSRMTQSATISMLRTTAPGLQHSLRGEGIAAAPSAPRGFGAASKLQQVEQEFMAVCTEERCTEERCTHTTWGASVGCAEPLEKQQPPLTQARNINLGLNTHRVLRNDLPSPQTAYNSSQAIVASNFELQDGSNNSCSAGSKAINRIFPDRHIGRGLAISKPYNGATTRTSGHAPQCADSTTTNGTGPAGLPRRMKLPSSSVVSIDLDAVSLAARTDSATKDTGVSSTNISRQVPSAIRDVGYCWHEVSATGTVDPVTGQHAILITQVDVTAKVEAERHLAFVTEAEHRLLEQIFPRHVLVYMTEEGGPWAAQAKGDVQGGKIGVRDINKLATSHAEVTLLFADIQGFTPMCKVLEPRVVMAFLNDLFTRFDERLDEFGVYKVETIGDCYFVAGGLIHEDEHGMAAVRARDSHADPLHAEKVLMFGKAMLAAASQVTLPTTGGPVRMRIGIHSGPVVSGVVGQRMPRFCLFGDTVNTASRMESTGVPGCIHASEAAWRLLRNESWVPTGGVKVKGKGIMNTYLWGPPEPEIQASLSPFVVSTVGRTFLSANSASVQSVTLGDPRGCGAGTNCGGTAN